MTVEERTQWAARAVCEDCGWIGDWRTSRTSQAAATQRAIEHLDYHQGFWHEENR